MQDFRDIREKMHFAYFPLKSLKNWNKDFLFSLHPRSAEIPLSIRQPACKGDKCKHGSRFGR